MKIAKQKLDSKKWITLRDAYFATLLAIGPLYAIIVLFGAPILDHGLQTLLLSCLVSLLAVFTPAYALGLPSFKSGTSAFASRLAWIRLFSEFTPRNPIETAILYPVVGAVTGAWSGAIPLALDWDRPWQKWPLTPTLGAVLGYVVGSLGATTVIGIESFHADLAKRRGVSTKPKSN
jgi:phosphatidylinositol glycan class F